MRKNVPYGPPVFVCEDPNANPDGNNSRQGGDEDCIPLGGGGRESHGCYKENENPLGGDCCEGGCLRRNAPYGPPVYFCEVEDGEVKKEDAEEARDH